MAVSWQKGITPNNFLRNVTFGGSPQNDDFIATLKQQVVKRIF